jgi:crossover junction endodeoxyribonuclease RuvC
VIRVSGDLPLARRLDLLYAGLVTVLEEYAPDEAAIEEIFTAKNARSALVLGHARGVLLLAAGRHCEVHEYAARKVKKAVAGYGQADKQQVGHMVKSLLGLPKVPAQDAADALAIALCHAYARPWNAQARAALAKAAAR